REVLTALERQARETEAKLAAVTAAKQKSGEALTEAQEALLKTEGLLPAQEGIETLEAELAAAQTETNSLRGRVAETRTELVTLEREHRTRVERQKAIALENERNLARITSAQEQIAALQERAAGAQAELTRLADIPRMVEQQRQKLMTELAAAERDLRDAADT